MGSSGAGEAEGRIDDAGDAVGRLSSGTCRALRVTGQRPGTGVACHASGGTLPAGRSPCIPLRMGPAGHTVGAVAVALRGPGSCGTLQAAARDRSGQSVGVVAGITGIAGALVRRRMIAGGAGCAGRGARAALGIGTREARRTDSVTGSRPRTGIADHAREISVRCAAGSEAAHLDVRLTGRTVGAGAVTRLGPGAIGTQRAVARDRSRRPVRGVAEVTVRTGAVTLCRMSSSGAGNAGQGPYGTVKAIGRGSRSTGGALTVSGSGPGTSLALHAGGRTVGIGGSRRIPLCVRPSGITVGAGAVALGGPGSCEAGRTDGIVSSRNPGYSDRAVAGIAGSAGAVTGVRIVASHTRDAGCGRNGSGGAVSGRTRHTGRAAGIAGKGPPASSAGDALCKQGSARDDVLVVTRRAGGGTCRACRAGTSAAFRVVAARAGAAVGDIVGAFR